MPLEEVRRKTLRDEPGSKTTFRRDNFTFGR